MRWIAAIVLLIFLFPMSAAEAYHFRGPLELLNNFEHVWNAQCHDPESPGGLVCQGFVDRKTAEGYQLFYLDQKPWKLLRFGRTTQPELVWQRSVCDGDPCR